MFKNFAYSLLSFLFTLNLAYSIEDAAKEFDRAWQNPDYLKYESGYFDINQTIVSDPELSHFHITQDDLWVAEKKKAYDPATYIPHVIKTGVATVFNIQHISPTQITFMRFSEQRTWLNESTISNVLEEVHVFKAEKKIIFLGRKIDNLSNNVAIKDHPTQPLFFVEHSVGGEFNTPFNIWRIVFLTKDSDFKEIVRDRLQAISGLGIPKFLEVYLRAHKFSQDGV